MQTFGRKRSDIIYKVMPALLTALVMLALFYAKGYAPFGGNSLAYHDGTIQYLDFHSYLKDLLTGKSSFGYSFSKTLGGSMVAVITYYLTSPISLLVLLFPKDKLHDFFDIAVLLKFMLASTTCSIFLRNRFEGRINDNIKHVMVSMPQGLRLAYHVEWTGNQAGYCCGLLLFY